MSTNTYLMEVTLSQYWENTFLKFFLKFFFNFMNSLETVAMSLSL